MDVNREVTIRNIRHFSELFYGIRTGDLNFDVDVTEYRFFYPKEILMLTEFFVVQNYNDINCRLISSDDNDWYFSSIDLVNFCNTNYKSPQTQKQSSSTSIPIMRVNLERLNEYIYNALRFFSKYCKGKDIDILSICISEIINNVYDHSKSIHDAYIFSQYYPNVNQIRFAIADLGVGIPATVNNYLESNKKERLDNTFALNWALEKGSSSKSQIHNIGAGLYNVVSYLKGVGSIEIFTENVYCKIDRIGGKSFKRNPIENFIGTLIEIRIEVDRLEQIDETILDEFVF